MEYYKVHKIILLLFFLVFICCNSEDTPTEHSSKCEVTFTFDLNFHTTKTIVSSLEDVDIDNLNELIASTQLYAQIAFVGTDTFTLKIHQNEHGNFVTEAFAMTEGIYYFEYIGITDQNNTLLFYTPHEGTLLAQHVPFEERIGNKYIEIDDTHFYRKSNFDIWVITTQEIVVDDFGFAKWNIHAISVNCIPFMINICTDKGDISATGQLKIEYLNSSGQFEVLSDFSFSSNGNIHKICFKDDLSRSNEEELHRFTLTLQDNIPIVRTVNLDDLNNYRNTPEWNAEFNFLHLNFCTSNRWIFKDSSSKES